MSDTVKALDRTWGSDKLSILVNGFCLSGENLLTGMSAYEQRVKAYDGGEPDGIIEPAQLDQLVRTIADDDVRNAIQLRVRTGEDEWIIESFLGTKRRGHHLIERGIELMRRESSNQASRIRLERGEHPVCWRCRSNEVAIAGEECVDCPGAPERGHPGRQQGDGLTPVDEWSLEKLVKTQDYADQNIPGQTTWRKYVGGEQRTAEWQGIPGGRRRRVYKPSE